MNKEAGRIYIDIHPNAFATELISMITENSGPRYLITAANTLLRLNDFSPCITSASMPLTPITLDTSRQVAIAAIGIITELVRKSKKSRNCMPITVTAESGP